MSVDRGFTWMEDETLSLIDIFSRSDIQEELRGAKRNITVYEKVASELSEIGYSRTAYQCREKIKRLRKEYQHNKYCFANNVKPKKPMKHYELVDKIFNLSYSPEHLFSTELNIPGSENEEDRQSIFPLEKESDASNSFPDDDHISPGSILPEQSLSELNCENSNMLLEVKMTSSPLMGPTDSDSNLFLNGDHNFDLSGKDSPLNEMNSPWVPNVVLVENEPLNEEVESTSENEENLEKRLEDFSNINEKEILTEESNEPPTKKRKDNMMKLIFDNIADNFLKYQESAETRFIERITQLEQERMRRDENMQKLWLEFEERRRKEEQQHELKMLSLLGQFVNQMNGNSTKQDS